MIFMTFMIASRVSVTHYAAADCSKDGLLSFDARVLIATITENERAVQVAALEAL